VAFHFVVNLDNTHFIWRVSFVLRVARVCKHFHVLIVCCVESASLWIFDMKCKRIKANHSVSPAHYVEPVLYVCVVRSPIDHRHLPNQWRHHLHLDDVTPVQHPHIQSAVSYNRHIYNNTLLCNICISTSFRYLIHAGYIESTHTMELHVQHAYTHVTYLFCEHEWKQLRTQFRDRNTVFHLPICLLSMNFIVVCHLSTMTTDKMLSLTHALSVVWLNI